MLKKLNIDQIFKLFYDSFYFTDGFFLLWGHTFLCLPTKFESIQLNYSTYLFYRLDLFLLCLSVTECSDIHFLILTPFLGPGDMRASLKLPS